MSGFCRFAKAVQRYGILAALRRAFWLGLQLIGADLIVVRRVIFFRTDIDEAGSLPLQDSLLTIVHYDLRSLQHNAGLAQRIESFGGMSPGTVNERMKRGDVVFLATLNERLAGMYWLCFDSLLVEEVQLVLELHQKECCGYHAFVGAEYRGQGIWPLLAVAAQDYARERRIRWQYGWILTENLPSLHAASKVWRRPTKTVTMIQWPPGARPLRLGWQGGVPHLSMPAMAADQRSASHGYSGSE